MTIGVDAVSDVGESHPRVGRFIGIGAAPIEYVAGTIAGRAGINRKRIGVVALAHPAARSGAGTLEGPGRSLILALEDAQEVGVRTAYDGEVSAGALDVDIDHLHSGRIANRRSERNLDLADAGAGVSGQLSRDCRRGAVENLAPVISTVERSLDANAVHSREQDASAYGRGRVEPQRIGLGTASTSSQRPVLSGVNREIQTAARGKVQVRAVGGIDRHAEDALVHELTRVADVAGRKSRPERDPAIAAVGRLQNSDRGVELDPLIVTSDFKI